MTITGDTLIAWGFKPGRWFKPALAAANAAEAAGLDEPAIQRIIETMKREPVEPGKPATAGVVTEPSARGEVPLTFVGTDHDVHTMLQLERCVQWGSAVKGVLCADGHLGYAQPVGGVIAYTDHISVSGVGYDIGCGNMAVRTDIPLDRLKLLEMDKLADDIARDLSFGVGRVNAEPVDHPLFDDDELWREADVRPLKQMAQAQLGTIGSGNHYVDVFADENDMIWIGVHFGSRGLGHKIATKYLKLAGGKDGIDSAPTVLEVDSDIGRAYIAGMTLAGKYAYAGREWVVDKVCGMIGALILEVVHNHHNYAWRELHRGASLWVVRKGATPAFPGQLGFVGGSMCDDAVIIEGRDTTESYNLLHSTIHGAGRLFGRREAKRRFTAEQMHEWRRKKGVILRGAGVDESPMAYRRLDDVLEQHASTINVNHRLRPLIVVMAGEGEADPFRD